MINFVFISPEFPKTYYNFCDRLKKNGVRVLGISSTPYENLKPELKNCLTEYYKVSDMNNYDEFVKAMGYFTYKYGKIDWVESNNEHWLTLDAKIRKDFNISTGINSDDIINYKSKSEMKKFYKEAKIPTPRYIMVSTLDKAEPFIERVGYPVVVKPDIGVGASHTYKICNDEELKAFYDNLPTDGPYIMEELISGDIITYDGICDSEGNVLVEASHVTPPIMNIVNDKLDISYYTNIKVSNRLSAVGKRAIKAFNVKSRFFHLEFFKLKETKRGLGKAGRYVALEANMRPGGGYTPDMINFANSFDIYQLWADMVAYDKINHIYTGDKYYCVYASRRDDKTYAHNNDEIYKTFNNCIVMHERMPEVLSDAMGNEMYTAKVETIKEVETFVDYVLEKK